MRLELTQQQRVNLGNLDGEYTNYQEIFETILYCDTDEYDYETFDMGRDEDGNEIIKMSIWKDSEDTEDDYNFTIILDDEE